VDLNLVVWNYLNDLLSLNVRRNRNTLHLKIVNIISKMFIAVCKDQIDEFF